MHRTLLITMLLLAAASLTGCTVCLNAKRTLIDEPALFNWKRNRVRSQQLYVQWGEAAWRATGKAEAGCDSPAYYSGYIEGFADYVYGGGNGEPPAVPPREYWNADLRNESGQRLADDWFSGYRHGAATARAGGYRDLVVLRSSLYTEVAEVSTSGGSASVEFYEDIDVLESAPHSALGETVLRQRNQREPGDVPPAEAHTTDLPPTIPGGKSPASPQPPLPSPLGDSAHPQDPFGDVGPEQPNASEFSDPYSPEGATLPVIPFDR